MRTAKFFKDIIQLIYRLILFLISPVTALIGWIRPVFEGSDGLASGKRFTTYLFGFLAFYMIWQDKITTMVHFYGFLAVLGVILMMWGIITFSNINQAIRSIKGAKEDQDESKLNQEEPKP